MIGYVESLFHSLLFSGFRVKTESWCEVKLCSGFIRERKCKRKRNSGRKCFAVAVNILAYAKYVMHTCCVGIP